MVHPIADCHPAQLPEIVYQQAPGWPVGSSWSSTSPSVDHRRLAPARAIPDRSSAKTRPLPRKIAHMPHARKPAPRLLLSLVLLAAALLSPAWAADGAWSMRARVFCDPDWGIAFRYPYEYRAPDQYAAAVSSGRSGGSFRIEAGENMSPDELRKLFQQRLAQARTAWDARAFCHNKDELPSDLGDLADKPLAEVASALMKEYLSVDVAFEPATYYETDNPRRPHADPEWAPEGIEAVRPVSAADFGGWFCDLGDRYVGVLCRGDQGSDDNSLIADSFEVLRPQRRGTPQTWRHAMMEKGYAIGPDDELVKARSYRPDGLVSWRDGWSVESEHYHIQVQSHPGKAIYFAGYLEKLYEAFVDVYDPDSVPPYKMEIKIFDTQRNFMQGAGAHGIPVGPSVGGFFLPGHLAIFVYEDSGKLSPDFAVEHVLAHECSHQFLHTTCNGSSHVPTWINEGMAVYFESAKYDGRRFSWFPPRQRLDRLQMIYQRSERPMADLEYYMNHYGHISPAQYAEVYAITHFWVFGVKGGKKRFKEYWQALKEGENGTEAFQRIFMDDMIKAQGGLRGALRAFDKALVQYVTAGSKPAYRQGR